MFGASSIEALGLGALRLHFNWLGAFESALVPTYLKDRLGPFDTHVITMYKDYVITSPNANFIPEPYLFEEVVMRPLHDGHLGVYDCFQWPQLYCNTYKWTGYIPCEESYCDDPVQKWCWWNITESPQDFLRKVGSCYRVGRVHPDKFQQLSAVYVDLQEHVQLLKIRQPSYTGPLKVDAWMRTVKRALQRLKDLPLMFRDFVIVVTTFQCLALDVFGMLHYLDRFSSNPPSLVRHAVKERMGVFTD
ncbi:hypothetical protein BU15DRAFT_59934 [Melanogaster broomeanus]|nr:hypothetical protein BU15DRAFT_59934 [Melanogaster broomeanus]